jgi:hypothetical protein
VKEQRTGPGKELGSPVSRPSSGLCCRLKQVSRRAALVAGLSQRWGRCLHSERKLERS